MNLSFQRILGIAALFLLAFVYLSTFLLFRKSLKRDPDAIMPQGLDLKKDEALLFEHYSRRIDDNPYDFEALRGIAGIYLQRGDYEEALKNIDAIVGREYAVGEAEEAVDFNLYLFHYLTSGT